VWLEAWAELLALLDREGITSLAEFERQFGAKWVVLDWIHALDNELWNVGLDDPQYLRTRIALCEDSLKRFAADEFFSETCRMALAESHFELNDVAQTDSLYRQWLSTDPQWGWGWISWAHCYQSARLEMKDLNRAEQILIEGRSVVQVRDPDDITRNLAYIYQQQGRLQASRQLLASVQSTSVRPSGVPKVGRNDPCPCGSGKKFKKCCGNHIFAT
jgi:tetratricopeptide (TPR) repeat protein